MTAAIFLGELLTSLTVCCAEGCDLKKSRSGFATYSNLSIGSFLVTLNPKFSANYCAREVVHLHFDIKCRGIQNNLQVGNNDSDQRPDVSD